MPGDQLSSVSPISEQLRSAARKVAGHHVLAGVLRAAGVSAMVLNRKRQILYANDELLQLVGTDSVARLVGLLPGDALGCINASEGSTGCGSSPHCEGCHGSQAVLDCQDRGEATTTDCVLTVQREKGQEALELSVKAAPLKVDGESLTVVTLRDISSERRREALERVFFHDVLNTITGLYGHVRLLEEDPSAADSEEIMGRIVRICERLRREVTDQRSLLEAEVGVLRPDMTPASTDAILDALRQFFAGHTTIGGKSLVVERDTDPPCGDLVTDSGLVVRVLINMLKNAFEATPVGGEIRLRCWADDGGCNFSVWNAGRIPDDVASQIFRRRFSTKGDRGRGLGTHSMKLFGERYLGGKVSFTTSDAGTEFRFTLPADGGRQPR